MSVLALASACPVMAQAHNDDAPTPELQIVTPIKNQVFASGDTVHVSVKVGPSLAGAIDPDIFVSSVDDFPGTGYNGSGFQSKFQIPSGVAGFLTITPELNSLSANPIQGPAVTIQVRANSAPSSLEIAQPNMVLTSSTATAHLFVTGHYGQGSNDLNLTSSASGTTYISSNPNILTVDSEGSIEAVAFGMAVVTVNNNGVQAFATVTVEDPNKPLPSQNLTSATAISRSGLKLDRTSGYYVQTVQVTNINSIPIIGPFYFVVANLSDGVRLINAGTTKTITPIGSSYISISLPDGVTIQPGSSVYMMLQFLNPGQVAIQYSPQVYSTLSKP